MTLSSLFIEKVIKSAAILFQIQILIVSGACDFEFEFYPSCNPAMSKCIILEIFNQSAPEYCASANDAMRGG